MYEDRLKKVKRYETSIEKKKNIIIRNMESFEKVGLIKLKVLFKKFNTDILRLKFKEIKYPNNYKYETVTPELIIHYGEYSIELDNNVSIGRINDWCIYGNENMDVWYEYLALIGHLANAMHNKKPIYNFLTKRFKKLTELTYRFRRDCK